MADERKRRALARVEPIDLSATTWPEYPPSTVVNAITYAARRGLHRYLDRHATALRSELAHTLGVERERLVVGDGAAQLLGAAAQALLEPADELVTPWPSYGLYPVIARRARGHAVPVEGFGAQAVLRAVNERTRLVALCNPNDPTGELLAVDELRSLLAALPERVVVLLDEALRDFVDAERARRRARARRRVPAPARLSHLLEGVGPGRAARRLRRRRPRRRAAARAARARARAQRARTGRRAGGAAPRVRRRRRPHSDGCAQRARLVEGLLDLGLDVAPSQANVLWLRADAIDGGELAHRLERHGVIVAPGGPLGDGALRPCQRPPPRGGRPSAAGARARVARLRSGQPHPVSGMPVLCLGPRPRTFDP